ncbi:MAG: hypothetical protein OHK0022_46840 [Roseiflexaceae bacterium]
MYRPTQARHGLPEEPVRLATRRERVAEVWFLALDGACGAPPEGRALRRQISRLADQLVDAAAARVPDRAAARAVGAQLVRLGYRQPASLGVTLATLPAALLEGGDLAELPARMERVQVLLAALAEGFCETAHAALLAECPAAPVPAPGSTTAENDPGLTAREHEVLHLLVAGHTNIQIGDQLGISTKTVEKHLSNLYTKLGIGSRVEATAWAARSGILAGS